MAAEKKMAEDGYDKIAEPYLAWAQQHPFARMKYLDALLAHLPADAHVLELGCGAGAPVLEKLAAREAGKVTGNDISKRQLELAQARCPGAALVHGDMTALAFADGSLDGVVAFYSLIHLPRAEQPAMLARIFRWLRPGGCLVLNLATADEPGHRQPFFGADMFWSSYDVPASKKMAEAAGFRLLSADVEGSGEALDRSDPDYGTEFLWIVAQKPSTG